MPRSLAIPARNSLGDEVYEKLVSEIVSMRFPPGDRLSVDGLARLFEVSQTPIRAALIRLEVEGLVEKKHNAGFRVTAQHSAERFHNLYELRSLLEPAAAANVATSAGEKALNKLVRLNDNMARTVAEDPKANYGKFALLDREFHDVLSNNCGNDLIADALSRLHTHVHIFRLRYHSTVATDAVKEHQLIVDAILAGKPTEAERAMRLHIEKSRQRMEPFYMRQ